MKRAKKNNKASKNKVVRKVKKIDDFIVKGEIESEVTTVIVDKVKNIDNFIQKVEKIDEMTTDNFEVELVVNQVAKVNELSEKVDEIDTLAEQNVGIEALAEKVEEAKEIIEKIEDVERVSHESTSVTVSLQKGENLDEMVDTVGTMEQIVEQSQELEDLVTKEQKIETNESETKIKKKEPKEKVLGFSLYERNGVWYAGKRIADKLKWVYVGKDKSIAEDKIQAWCSKKGILIETLNKPQFKNIQQRLESIEEHLSELYEYQPLLKSLQENQEKNAELLQVVYDLVKENNEIKKKLNVAMEKCPS